MTDTGSFIVLEGPDGGGKTTIAQRLRDTLSERGSTVCCVREPGGSVSGEMIREILLSTKTGKLTAVTETLLFYAARAQLIHEVIRPALSRGETVIADRYELSTWAYQSCAGGLPLDAVQSVGRFSTGDLHPDICLVLDVPVEIGIGRKSGDGELDRMETKSIDYKRKLRDGYIELVKQVHYPAFVIDATRTPDEVFADVLQEVNRVLG